MKTSATSGRDNVSFIWTAFCVLEFFIMKNYNVPGAPHKYSPLTNHSLEMNLLQNNRYMRT